jgi:hypothetical protein
MPSWTLTPAADPWARWEILKPDNQIPAEPAWVQELELAIKNCPGHLWQLVLEDCGTACLNCERCPAGIDDLYPDGQEMIHFQGDGFQIDSGTHDLTDDDTPRTIPVTARVESGYNYWGECDAEIVIEPRST